MSKIKNFEELIKKLEKGVELDNRNNNNQGIINKIMILLQDINLGKVKGNFYIKIRVNSRIYEFGEGFASYHSKRGRGKYYTPKSWYSIEKFISKKTKKTRKIELVSLIKLEKAFYNLDINRKNEIRDWSRNNENKIAI